MVQICLAKSDKSAGNVWPSLLDGQFDADPLVFDKMEKKMTLERFQREVRKITDILLRYL